MVSLLPPYTKTHIIVLGSITLLAGFALLFILNMSHNVIDAPKVTTTTAAELKHDTELKELLAKTQQDKADAVWAMDNFVIIDVRTNEEYAKMHIVGSQNAPLQYLESSSLNPEVDMVVYSDDQEELDKAVAILSKKNIQNIHKLNATMQALKEQGYTLTTSE